MMQPNPRTPIIRARDGSPAAIAAARVRQADAIKHGPLGPIASTLSILHIPMMAEASAPVARPAITSARRAPVAAPWTPSFRVVAGLAAAYGMTTDSKRGPSQFAPFAFAAAMRDGEVFCTIDHSEDLRLASRLQGSLRLHETLSGLYFELNPFATAGAQAMGLYARVQRGDFVGCSIRYGDVTASTVDGIERVTSAGYLIEVSLITRARVPVDRGTWVAIERPGCVTHSACPTCRRQGRCGVFDVVQRTCSTCDRSRAWGVA